MHKYDDNVMAADWFVVPSAVKLESAYSIAGFRHERGLGSPPSVHGARTMRFPLNIDHYLTDVHIIAYRIHCSFNPRFTQTNAGAFT